jgi:hypothetical protein
MPTALQLSRSLSANADRCCELDERPEIGLDVPTSIGALPRGFRGTGLWGGRPQALILAVAQPR